MVSFHQSVSEASSSSMVIGRRPLAYDLQSRFESVEKIFAKLRTYRVKPLQNLTDDASTVIVVGTCNFCMASAVWLAFLNFQALSDDVSILFDFVKGTLI